MQGAQNNTHVLVEREAPWRIQVKKKAKELAIKL